MSINSVGPLAAQGKTTLAAKSIYDLGSKLVHSPGTPGTNLQLHQLDLQLRFLGSRKEFLSLVLNLGEQDFVIACTAYLVYFMQLVGAVLIFQVKPFSFEYFVALITLPTFCLYRDTALIWHLMSATRWLSGYLKRLRKRVKKK